MANTRILIVEDEGVTALHIRRDLEMLGYAVCGSVSSGAHAIQKAIETQPDLVLMDIQLQGELDGVQAAQQIREQFDIPVVYLTAHSDASVLQRAQVTEPYGYLLKPFEEHELRVTIEMALSSHRLKKQLKESEARYRELADSITDVFFAMDRDLRCSYWNKASEQLTGLSAQEAIGKYLHDLFPEVRGTRVERLYLEAIKTQHPQSLVTEYQLGRRRFFEVTAYPAGGGLAVFVRDITGRKQAEQDLARRAGEMAAINRASQAMASTLELDKVLGLVIAEIRNLVNAEEASVLLQDGQELIFAATASDVASKLVGMRMPVASGVAGWVMQHGQAALVGDARRDPRFYDRIDAVTGMTTQSLLVVPLIVKGVIRGVIEAINKAGGVFGEHDLEMLEAMAGPAAIAIENARLFAAVDKELIQREQAEAELQARNQDLVTLNAIATTIGQSLNLDYILNATLDHVLQAMRMDGGSVQLLEEDGSTLALAAQRGMPGPMAKRLERLKLGEGITGQIALTGQPFVASNLMDVLEHQMETPTEGGSLTFAGVPIRSKDKTLGVLAVVGFSPRTLSPQEQQLLIAIGYQVGVAVENARLAEQAAEMQALRELDRLRSELIANVSHELRTPLGLIKVFATTLLRKDVAFDRETQLEFLSDIEKETDRLEKTVDNLLDLSRMQSGRMQLDRHPTDLGELIRRIMSDPEIQLAPHHFICDLPSEPLVASVDARRIEQVLRNLLSNAIKYSPDGGTIVVQGRGDERQLFVRVSDQGIGIPLQDQEKVFERFYRGDNEVTRRVGGVGLGLAVCRGIVAAHGGRIWVESVLGKGSTFCFTLPANNKPEPKESVEAGEAQP